MGLEASRQTPQPSLARAAALPPDTVEHNGVRYRPIQTYQPCDRVLGKNPELTASDRALFGPAPDPATWKLLTLLAPKTDGTTADVSIVQPPEWLAKHNPTIGGTVPLDVPECGIEGNAKVLAIERCPPVKPGPGPVVLATFRHHVGSTVQVHVTGLDTPIGCTGNHPFWSEDRQAFIRADELHQGEHLSTLGETTHVAHIEIDPTPKFVYNLMVQGEHVYHVAIKGVLVHNGGCGTRSSFDPRGNNVAFREPTIDPVQMNDVRPFDQTMSDVEQPIRWVETPDGDIHVLQGNHRVMGASIDDVDRVEGFGMTVDDFKEYFGSNFDPSRSTWDPPIVP